MYTRGIFNVFKDIARCISTDYTQVYVCILYRNKPVDITKFKENLTNLYLCKQ